jgi:ribosomal protein S18 acetylase RimI-like enzyme
VQLHFVDVQDEAAFADVPPCADPRFDHRTCDYWEDAEHGSKLARPALLRAREPSAAPRGPLSDNPFAPVRNEPAVNPFMPTGRGSTADPFANDENGHEDRLDWNPFKPDPGPERPRDTGLPRKLGLLDRGRRVFGSYAKVALASGTPVAYAQFGPLSAYPRAIRLRELYPQLPEAPLPAVITCVATTPEARRNGHARALIEEICRDLAGRGFAAVEAYPDLTLPDDETSAGRPRLWLRCGFSIAVDDERFPVMRMELDG